ncbi:MAG: DUF3419 family protein [Candidatus Melainabacteria bacterium]|nr:DUF3419 family protein [Candidatus Melainabacteria bacterium]
MNTLAATKNLCETGETSPDRRKVGGKGFNLIRLKREQLEVPAFLVLTSETFFQSLGAETRARWSSMTAIERHEAVQNLRLNPAALTASADNLDDLFDSSDKIAVRSSAADEDGSTMSYAGQFASVLNVGRTELAAAIETVWRSGFSKQLIAYRTLNGLNTAPEAPCVILQQMVTPKTAGVAFGADPLTGDRDVIIVSAVEGLADKLVSGEVDSATYRVRGTSIELRTNESLGFLTDQQISQIKSLVEQTNQIFGSPQDIEWAIDDNDKLFILQSRPITTLGACSPDSVPPIAVRLNPVPSNAVPTSMVIFDNSNIGESYPGMTTPLTYSFARKAYQHVYEEFCRLMGVSEKSIKKHAHIFPDMLGFVRGRIYYNLLNWYRLLSLFPGFKTNRGFMEQMMGVKAGLPADFLAEFDKPLPAAEKLADALSLMMVIPKLLSKWFFLPQDIKAFNRRVENSFTRVPANLGELSESELASLYRSLEKDLLLHWDAPIVNDFFAMVSFGLLRGVCAKWFKNMDGIHNQLLCGETGIISTEPVARMKELAAEVSINSRLIELLKSGDVKRINSNLSEFPKFHSLYQSYLDKFGDRCAGELKLESPTVVDNPQALISGVLRLATQTPGENEKNSVQAQKNRSEAEELAFESLGNNLVKAFVFNMILNQTRTRIRERENLRFMRTRVFGLVRKIFIEVGKRFESAGELNNPQEIFYLETEEVLAHIERRNPKTSAVSKTSADLETSVVSATSVGSETPVISETAVASEISDVSSSFSLKAIVEARKNELEIFKNMPAPPDRFAVLKGADLNEAALEAQSEELNQSFTSGKARQTVYKGLGCCPGIVRGYARVIDDPDTQQLKPGEILVAKRTDPGWITVIAQATGIVVEYGSLLSHTAIVSRELGIPTIVSVSNVTTSVKTGEWLEINGATGEVRVAPSQGVVALAANTEENEVLAMKSEIQSKAGFSFVRYAQCWEDADIVVEAMKIKADDKCLSIASAGDNSLAILAKNPGKVVALDLNPAQLALLELKAAAFKHLDYQDMLVLLGYRTGKNRVELFESIEAELTAGTRDYWRKNISDIESGVASCGKFEKYFALFRKFVLPLVHSQQTVDELLQWKSKEQRAKFYTTTWNTPKWRALFKIFFSQFVMGILGRDPSFFKYAEGGLAEILLKWTRKALVDQNPSNNPYLHWILNGEFGSTLPNFLRRENFDAIKANINKLEWHQLSLEEYLSAHPDEQFNSFNLSDVFEYVSEANYKTMLKLIAGASQPNAQVVYWNMMAPRTAKVAGVEQMKSLTALSQALFAENKTFFYSRFVVEQVRIDNSCQSTTGDVREKTTADNKDRAA